MAKYLDQNGLLYFWQQVKPMIDGKVSKEDGKVLSTNDLTDELLAKLNGVAEGAQVNVLEKVKVNGVEQTITDKAVDIAVPTKTSDLTNDSGFITSSDIPEGAAASTTVPKAATESGSVGTEMAFARGDHSHPIDTTRAAAADLDAAEERIAAIEADYLKEADKYDDTALSNRVKAVEDDYLKSADKTELAEDIAEAQAAAEKKATDLNTAMDTRVKAIEDDYLTSADKYDDTALAGRVTTVEGQVTTLIGSDANKSVRTIANEELAAQLIGPDAKESLDTLEEIAAWIQNHPDDASAMNAAIVALQNQLKGIAAGEGTVKKYVDDAIIALSIGDYAKAADLTALAGRVTTLEGASHTHANKDLLDTYTQTEANLADAVAKKHSHTFNEAELNKIAEGDVAKWNAAQANAEATAAAALASAKSELEGKITAEETRAKAAEEANATAAANAKSAADAAQADVDAVAALVDTGNQTVSAYVAEQIAENVVVISNSEIDTILATA